MRNVIDRFVLLIALLHFIVSAHGLSHEFGSDLAQVDRILDRMHDESPFRRADLDATTVAKARLDNRAGVLQADKTSCSMVSTPFHASRSCFTSLHFPIHFPYSPPRSRLPTYRALPISRSRRKQQRRRVLAGLTAAVATTQIALAGATASSEAKADQMLEAAIEVSQANGTVPISRQSSKGNRKLAAGAMAVAATAGTVVPILMSPSAFLEQSLLFNTTRPRGSGKIWRPYGPTRRMKQNPD
eukprot:gnl/MRDRNA2_/MRDRNA2_56059_c0_seq1.p1 gnl/MRDRNA2_/MRDRNA2_56059_c0~~gnl/MRDRNA2_/MRDRNA2_56059_c0_seq1.p1  ORF type:complete len:243 (+),score=31.27 gnl/MRDRNA2_/MRDRNA2_56059_c0_seq1:90-818(+)